MLILSYVRASHRALPSGSSGSHLNLTLPIVFAVRLRKSLYLLLSGCRTGDLSRILVVSVVKILSLPSLNEK